MDVIDGDIVEGDVVRPKVATTIVGRFEQPGCRPRVAMILEAKGSGVLIDGGDASHEPPPIEDDVAGGEARPATLDGSDEETKFGGCEAAAVDAEIGDDSPGLAGERRRQAVIPRMVTVPDEFHDLREVRVKVGIDRRRGDLGSVDVMFHVILFVPDDGEMMPSVEALDVPSVGLEVEMIRRVVMIKAFPTVDASLLIIRVQQDPEGMRRHQRPVVDVVPVEVEILVVAVVVNAIFLPLTVVSLAAGATAAVGAIEVRVIRTRQEGVAAVL